jgi:hypothetical protein
MVSNIQPSEATISTHQWYPFSALYQGADTVFSSGEERYVDIVHQCSTFLTWRGFGSKEDGSREAETGITEDVELQSVVLWTILIDRERLRTA